MSKVAKNLIKDLASDFGERVTLTKVYKHPKHNCSCIGIRVDNSIFVDVNLEALGKLHKANNFLQHMKFLKEKIQERLDVL